MTNNPDTTNHKGRHLLVAALFATTALLAILPGATSHPEFEEASTALDNAHAAAANPASFPNAQWFYWPPGAATNDDRAAGTFEGERAALPSQGEKFSVMSSGRAGWCNQGTGPQSTFCSRSNSGNHNGGYDSVVLAAQVNVPEAHNMFSIDYQFCSEEFPEWVGTAYNDGAFVEWDVHDWIYSGSTVTAPHNFAYDEIGNLMTINVASMNASNGAGTYWDGCTCKLTSFQETTPGLHTVYVSVTDASDSIYDTGFNYDNMRSQYRPTKPETACNVLPPPLIFDWTPDPPLECLPVVFSIIDPIPSGGFTVTWDFGDGNIESTNELNITHKYASSGIYPVAVQMYDMSTSETLYGAADVEVLECDLQAEANGPYVQTELLDLPIFGEAFGYIDEDYTCQWTTASEELLIKSPSTCESVVYSEFPGDYLVKLEVYDSIMDQNDFDLALVRILPTPPDNSENEAAANGIPQDGTDPGKFGADTDGDGILDGEDKCPHTPIANNRDLDNDGLGNVCDPDIDGDAIQNEIDTCPEWADATNLDTDKDGFGDGCDIDDDNDGITDGVAFETNFADNCPLDANVEQSDLDKDGLGDVCDEDLDGDTVPNLRDAFPYDPTAWQDLDGDGIHDADATLDAEGGQKARDGRSTNGLLVNADRPTGPPWVLGAVGFLVAVGLVLVTVFLISRQRNA